MNAASDLLAPEIVISMQASRRPRTRLLPLVVPGMAALAIVMLLPLLWFLTLSLAEFGSIGKTWEAIVDTIGSRHVLSALSYTVAVSATVTLICLLIAYPMAQALVRSKRLVFNLMIAAIVVPYFTSTVVRTYAWMVLLGRRGLVNGAMVGMGLIDAPVQLMYTTGAVILGMTYVLLPYMVLTIYAAMKAIDHRLLQAAEGLGAPPWYTFIRVYAPLTMPGVISGSIIVFILSTGFFITPTLMGGKQDVMIGTLIQQEVEINRNWGLASIVSIFALGFILVLYAIYYRVAKLNRLLAQGDA